MTKNTFLNLQIDAPKDPKMAELLGQYGVVNEKKGYSASLQKKVLHESVNPSEKQSFKMALKSAHIKNMR